MPGAYKFVSRQIRLLVLDSNQYNGYLNRSAQPPTQYASTKNSLSGIYRHGIPAPRIKHCSKSYLYWNYLIFKSHTNDIRTWMQSKALTRPGTTSFSASKSLTFRHPADLGPWFPNRQRGWSISSNRSAGIYIRFACLIWIMCGSLGRDLAEEMMRLTWR